MLFSKLRGLNQILLVSLMLEFKKQWYQVIVIGSGSNIQCEKRVKRLEKSLTTDVATDDDDDDDDDDNDMENDGDD
jgi:hypothetical protein